MDISKKFYREILGGVFIAQLTGIKGEEWTSILNADSKTAPQLGISDALDVCFIRLAIQRLNCFVFVMPKQALLMIKISA